MTVPNRTIPDWYKPVPEIEYELEVEMSSLKNRGKVWYIKFTRNQERQTEEASVMTATNQLKPQTESILTLREIF